MIDDKQERHEIIKGTKCESCCDVDWCWNSLTSLRDECLGPFKDLEDCKTKVREFDMRAEEKAAMERWQRRMRYEDFRENRSLCEHKAYLAKRKKDEEGNDDE